MSLFIQRGRVRTHLPLGSPLTSHFHSFPRPHSQAFNNYSTITTKTPNPPTPEPHPRPTKHTINIHRHPFGYSSHPTFRRIKMSTPPTTTGLPPHPDPKPPLPRPIRIIMLHGYTQTPQSFYQKTRSLESHLQKTLPQLIPKEFLSPTSSNTTSTSNSTSTTRSNTPLPPTIPPTLTPSSSTDPITTPATKPVILTYAAGPLRLLQSDLPGYEAPPVTSTSTTTLTSTPTPSPLQSSTQLQEDLPALAWWIKSDPARTLVKKTLPYLLTLLSSAAARGEPFDGVIGFSQGGALAVLLAGLLEPPASTSTTTPPHISIPENIPPLSFCISYSGFRVLGDTPGEWDFLYDKPGGIVTPTLHFIGSLDTVVEEERTLAVVRVCLKGNEGREGGKGVKGEGEERSTVVYHPGGHYLPGGKQFLSVAAGWMAKRVNEARRSEVGGMGEGKVGGGKKEEEEKIEDMDFPF